jgi:two-component system, sensor histidine kinase and response regulator
MASQLSKSKKIKILYVDDELNNLTGFKASFRYIYQVLIALNVTEALDIVRQHPDIHVIFSDQRMPVTTGVQFFEQIRHTYPDPIRILITGFTDAEAIIDAINIGNIFRYVKKPWTEADIIAAVNEAEKFYVANKLMETKNRELQKAYDELDKFAYSVTHDLRGPLVSIKGAIDVAQTMDDMDELKNMVSLMKGSVSNLESFIQNIHDYYNVNRGELVIAELDFNDIVKEQLETYQLTAKMNHIRFKTEVNQAETFRGDNMSMKIILNNLLSNAFKYQKKSNEEKVVELVINVEEGVATIEIKDNGIGIAGNHIGDIFNMFFRATSQEPGSGFGLYNVKDALLKLNGEIKVDSTLDHGTTFQVKIRNK